MPDNPNISVVIPTFNRAHTLRRALDSVLGQTTSAREIIVIDDGSSDGTNQLLESHYPDIVRVRQDNMGVSHARNTGIRRATGDWIALLDSDDEWLPEKLEQQIERITSKPGTVLCHTEEIWIRNGKRVNAMNKHRKQGGDIFQHCLPLCVISPSSALIKRELFDEIGYFDESLPACEDYDLWLRICSRYPVQFIETPLIVKHGGHDDQLSRKHWGMDRFRVLALTNIIDSNHLDPEDRQAAIDMLIKKCNILAQGARKRDNETLMKHYQQLSMKYQRVQETVS